MINGDEKIRATHRDLRAIVYARQSTPMQVMHHRSSTERQVGLVDLAVRLGWPESHVELIDEDLGRSGKFSEQREGFQRLAAEVGLGKVGAVFSLDASRLARSSADWHRLIEIAGLTNTLLVDEQTVYDPRDVNDRLLLGMKGTMADFELVWLRQRMDGGRWHLARQGQYRVRPPVGYTYEDDTSTQLSLDPDEEIQRAVALLFARYRIAGSLRDVVRYFRSHNLRFPSRFGKEIKWSFLTMRRVYAVLKCPLYAGAYVHARTRRETIFVDGQRRVRVKALPISEWQVLIRDAHPAYLPWEEYVSNQQRMSESKPRRADAANRGAAREGRALLQGLLLCGVCGGRLEVRYMGTNGRYVAYRCEHLRRDATTSYCVSSSARCVDEPVVELVLSMLTQDKLIDATRVLEIVEHQRVVLDRQWKLRLERARYEAKRAERQYNTCEPENRVVARTLEKRWNDKLVELEALEREHEEVLRQQHFVMSDLERERVLRLARELPRLWREKTTTDRDRKLLLRLLIKDVSVRAVDVPRAALRLNVLWHTHAVTELEVDRLGRGAPHRKVTWRILGTSAGVQQEPNVAR